MRIGTEFAAYPLCVVGAMVLGSAALAQTATTVPPKSGISPPAAADQAAAPSTGKAANNGVSVNEIVVVASRREQKIESVPMAITAFSANERNLVGIYSVQDLTDFTPGLSYTSQDNRPYIRGVGRNSTNLATDSGVATYYNGIYYGETAATEMQKDNLFIGNIEVDRGPQNSLHGSNAIGGTINYASQMPTDQYYAEARTGAANYGEYFVEGVVSGPITDDIKFRLGANYTTMQGGYMQNVEGLGAQDGNMVNAANGTSDYFEAQIQGNFDHLDAWAMVSSGDFATSYDVLGERGNIPDTLFLNTNQFEPSGFFGLCGLPGVAVSANGAGCAPALNGGQEVVPGSVVTDAVTANQFPGNNPGNVNLHSFIQELTSTNNMRSNIALASKITYHFPSVDVTYLGGYEQFDLSLEFTGSADAGVDQYEIQGPAPLGNLTIYPTPNLVDFGEHTYNWSHELDFTSTRDSPFQYVAGVFWYHQYFFEPVDAGVEPDQPQMGAPEYINGLGATCAGGAPLCAAPLNSSHAFSTSNTYLTYDSYAGFVSGSYKFNDQWTFSGAVRYTMDEKDGLQTWRFTEFDAIPGLTAAQLGSLTPNIDLTPAAVATELATAYPGASKAFINQGTGFAERYLNGTWMAPTGEATLTWSPDSDTLFYARYARGYKAGGFSTYTIGAYPETKPEYSDTFEVGAKKVVGSTLTLNGAAFYYDYYDDQVPLSVETNGELVSVLDNLPLVHVYGLELEGVWRPIDPLLLSGEYSYLNTSIANAGGCIENTADPLAQQPGAKTAGCDNPTGSLALLQNITGNSLPESPPNKVTINALYTWSLPSGKLVFSGTFIWKDVAYNSVFNVPEYKQDAYSQVNLNLTYESRDGHYDVILFCHNLFNSLGSDEAIPSLMNTPPTTTTKEDILYGLSLIPPRTFGIQLQYRFQ